MLCQAGLFIQITRVDGALNDGEMKWKKMKKNLKMLFLKLQVFKCNF